MYKYVGNQSRSTVYVGVNLTDTMYVGNDDGLFQPEKTPATITGLSTFASGTGAISPDFTSSGRVTGDLLILAVESANQAITVPSGFIQFTSSPKSVGSAAAAGGVRLGLFWKKSVGTETTISVADTGDHTTAVGVVVHNYKSAIYTNLFLNSKDFTNGTYWHVDGISDGLTRISSSATPGPLGETAYRLQMASGASYQGEKFLYTDSGITPTSGGTMLPNKTYTLFLWARANSGTSKFTLQYFLNQPSAPDTSYFGPDLTATTTWTRYKITFTTLNETLYYSNIAINQASDLSAVDIIIAEAMIAEGDLDLDTPYVETTNAQVSLLTGINVEAGQVQTLAGTISFNDVTTTEDQCLVLQFVANDRDAASTSNLGTPSNANLASLTKVFDQTVTSGQGGGIGIISGVKVNAGAIGNTTVSNAASLNNASITVAISPA